MSIEKSVPQQAGGFIVKRYFGFPNNAACRQTMFLIDSIANNRYPIMFDFVKTCVSY